MFQALKKLTSKQDVCSPTTSESATPMAGSLQKRFSKGVNYNMKIIIKGDRNVGKSCLFKRLQGGSFLETYTQTEEIQVASIQWSFKATEDIVKVEVWDVVDKGKARPRQTGLKLVTTAALPDSIALDAEFLDVYKGTHGVIVLFDVTKSWTFDYVARELPKIPPEIPVLVLGNHCDMAHHRVISAGQAQSLIETALEGRSSEVIYAESSMRNGFGLRLLHKFLGLPFLRLQKETFLALIERNKRDTEICGIEIFEFLKSDDSDYNSFLNKLSDKRRQIADSNSRVTLPIMPHSSSNSSISSNTNLQKSIQSPEDIIRPTKSIIVGGGQPIVIPGLTNITQNARDKPLTMTKNNNNNSISTENNAASKASAMVSTLLKTAESAQNKSSLTAELRKMSIDKSKLHSVEEFCPDEGTLDRNFLEDIPVINSEQINSGNGDSDSDNDTINPMVAKFDDEPDNEINIPLHIESKSKPIRDNNIDSSLDKVNPLAKHKRKTEDSNNLQLRKSSISSEDIPGVSPDESLTTGFEENSDCWLPDTSIRRSPEGGEDTSSIPSRSQDLNVDDEISRSSEKIKSNHKKKKDKKDRDKDKDRSERKEKKKKRRSKTNELEDFLNGSDNTNRIEEAYEAI